MQSLLFPAGKKTNEDYKQHEYTIHVETLNIDIKQNVEKNVFTYDSKVVIITEFVLHQGVGWIDVSLLKTR